MRRTGQVISLTQVSQRMGLGVPQDLYTLCNDHATNAVYYRGADDSTFSGVHAALLTQGANPLYAGEKITVKGGVYDFVCVTGETSTCRVVYGNTSSAGGAVISPATIGLQKLILAAQGIMPVLVGYGLDAIAAGSTPITLHASTLCKYFHFYLTTGAAAVYYHEDGTNATAVTGALNKQFDATFGGKLIVLATPAKTITLWGASASGSICWSAGNDA